MPELEVMNAKAAQYESGGYRPEPSWWAWLLALLGF